jgi:hypothetical protein
MRRKEDFLVLIESLKGDWALCEEILSDNSRAWERIEAGAQDHLDWAALGYTMHAFYNTLENYFLRIGKFFENSLSRDAWHRELLDRMSLEIPGFRPALLDNKECKEALEELRGFRHVFRHHYGRKLKSEKVRLVQKYITVVAGLFPDEHRIFCEKLSRIADKME